MQYGVDLKKYVRVNNERKNASTDSPRENYFVLVFVLAMGFLLSRVIIPMNFSIIKISAPFGIAYLLAFNRRKNNKEIIAASVGATLGYITLANVIPEILIYISIGFIAVGLNYLPVILKKTTLNIIKFISFFIFIIGYNFLILSKDFLSNIVMSTMIILFILPSYFLLNYSMECITEVRSNHYFTSEEVISIELLISLLVVGIGSISIFDVYIRTVVAVFFMLLFAYIGKGNTGAVIGILMGVIIGIATKNFTFTVALYGVSALVAAIFKEGGRILTCSSFAFTFSIISFYSNYFTKYTIYELVIGISIFIFLPKKIIDKVELEFDDEKKHDDFNEIHFKKMKDELTKRLRDFTEVLTTMSLTLNTIVENEKLVDKNKGEALINNLADRVCSNCDFKKVCWKREMHETYTSFAELIENFEEKRFKFPLSLEKKCLKKATLMKVTEELVNNHVLQETVRQRLGEGRKLLSGHLNNMSLTVGEIVDDFNKEVTLSVDIERVIRKELIKNNIEFRDLFCYRDKEGRDNIKIGMLSCSGTQYCIKDVLPIINKTLGKNMAIGEECNINPDNKCCEVLIEEAPKFHVSSHVSLASKEGEKYTGDSYSIMKSKNGNYMALLCDGMGSGSRAGAESKLTVELMEKFSEVGFNEITAIDTINSIMSIKFSEEEKFSTLDMQKINLYTGDVRFIKVGAVESFIKRGKRVDVIESKTLPFGVLDSPDIDLLDYKLKGGDFIVTISDGVLDINLDGDLDHRWIVELLKTTRAKTAKELANEILSTAKEKAGGKAKDDMTVLVSKIYNLN